MFYGSRFKKKSRGRTAQVRKELPRARVTRTHAQVQVKETNEVVQGRIFLNDLSIQGVGIFLSAPIARGEEVFIVIEKPRHLFLRGRVAWCTLFRMQKKIISMENYDYRARIQFSFDSKEDEEVVKKYFEQLLAS